jgi:M6 family metalloprotease-like protein
MADLDEFTKPYYSLSKLSGVKEVLVILWDPHRPDHPAPDKSDIDALIFGNTASVKAWFSENSGGRFAIKERATLGWYDATHRWQFYWREGAYAPPSDPDDPHYYKDANGEIWYLDDEGFYKGHDHSYAEAIRDRAGPDFNYAPFDVDGDGVLQPAELPMLIVKPQNNSSGYYRSVVASQVPPKDLIVDGVKITRTSEAYIGQPLNMGVAAHELCHHTFAGADMYPDKNDNPPPERRAGAYSIMDVARTGFHLDPYHKLKLGWLNPRLIARSGPYSLRDVETTGEVLILHDPNFGPSEFFLVENRWPGTSFDSELPARGLAIWHAIEDPSLAADWGRRAVSLRRANGGTPSDDAKALFDGSSSGLGYDLHDDSEPQNLRFRNNRRSGIRISKISAAGRSMELHIDVTLTQPYYGSASSGIGIENI